MSDQTGGNDHIIDYASEHERGEALKARFTQAFGGDPDFIARAPGRINLIGEHTDYNGGFVLPVAIDRTVLIATRALPTSRQVHLVSINFGNRTQFDLDAIAPTTEPQLGWSNYVRAVAWALAEQGMVDLKSMPGAHMAVEGNVPVGSGLSSSAAIEVASALCFVRLAGASMESVDRVRLALACQKAENEFIGVKSGIMDQFISALAQPNSALLIDTRSLDYEVVPLDLEACGYKLVAVDSAVPRSLITSAYNQRRAECEQAVRVLAPLLGLGPGAQLRDVTPEQLEAYRDVLPPTLYRRARHVVTENARVLQAVTLMREGLGMDHNMDRLGQLLHASHVSLHDDYEVSSRELDLLVELAEQVPGVAGARMTGAGFGGCTVNIVQESHLHEFEEQVVKRYRAHTGLPARIYVCRAVGGGSYLDG
jgi:galactokinase